MPIDNLSKITSRSGINTTILLEAGNANVTGIITAAGFDGPFTGGGGNNAGIVTAVGGLHVGTAGTVLHAINDSDVAKVGIGTTIPTAKLEISHPTHTSLVRLKRTTGNAGDFTMQIGGSNPGVIFDAVGISSDFIFQTQGTEIMRIDSLNKEVGIGTDNPFCLLDVFRKATGTNKDIFSVRSHSGAFAIQCSDVAAANPTWALRTFSSEDLVFSPGGNADVHEKVRIRASDGSVGIGTDQISKYVTIKAVHPFVRLEAADTSDKRLDFQVSSTGIATISAEQSSQQLSFKTTSGEALRIKSDGKVGIGTDDPDGKLDVRGTIFVNGDGTGGRIFASGGSLSLTDGNGRQTLRIDDPGSGNSHTHVFDSSGNATFAGIVNATSFVKTGGTGSQYLMADGTTSTGSGGGGGADIGISTNTNYIGTGVTNFNFVGTGITASLTAGASADTVANVFIPSAVRKTTRFVATANQTTFTGLNYSVGYVDVFLNGIKLDGQDEFTATNGTSVVLTDGATVNDIVEIVAQEISANLTITGIANVVEDISPELGGNLDVNGKDISGTGDVNLTGIVTATTFSGGVDLSGLLKEGVNVTAGKLSDNTSIDLANGMVHLFTTEETTTSTPDLVFGGSSVNAKMDIGEAITVVIITTADATGYSAQLTIDSGAATEQWLGGTTPSAGGADGYDVYTHNIIKTADATFVVLSNLVNFT